MSGRQPPARGRDGRHGANPKPTLLERALRLACCGTGREDVVADHDRHRLPRASQPLSRPVADGHRPGQVGGPLPGVEPGLVEHRATHLEESPDPHPGTGDSQPTSGRSGDPQHRVVPALADDRGSRGHRHQHAEAFAEHGCGGGRQHPAEWFSERVHGVLLVGQHHCPQQVGVLPRGDAGRQAGRTGRGPDDPAARRQGCRAGPAQRAPRRSAAHAAAPVDEVEPSVQHPFTLTVGVGRRIEASAACGGQPGAGGWGRSAHVRRGHDLRVGARPVAVAAEGVEPLGGGDQPQRQRGVGVDHHRLGRSAKHARLDQLRRHG